MHCCRELIHAVWNLLLDDAFIYAFKYGMVIKCANGVERRVYPRFFTYSADYPEKCVFSYWYSFSCPYANSFTIREILAGKGKTISHGSVKLGPPSLGQGGGFTLRNGPDMADGSSHGPSLLGTGFP